ncbi:MAG: 3TM-type holin [Candidatus Puniceispirillales bacterium]
MSLLSLLAGLGSLSGITTARPGAKKTAGETALQTAAGVVDALFTSDEERLDRAAAQARIISRGDVLQAHMNSIESRHPSLLVAGWRPFIGWVCGVALLWHFLLRPMADFVFVSFGITTVVLPVFDLGELNTILFGMLGLGTLRTAEKAAGKA